MLDPYPPPLKKGTRVVATEDLEASPGSGYPLKHVAHKGEPGVIAGGAWPYGYFVHFDNGKRMRTRAVRPEV